MSAWPLGRQWRAEGNDDDDRMEEWPCRSWTNCVRCLAIRRLQDIAMSEKVGVASVQCQEMNRVEPKSEKAEAVTKQHRVPCIFTCSSNAHRAHAPRAPLSASLASLFKLKPAQACMQHATNPGESPTYLAGPLLHRRHAMRRLSRTFNPPSALRFWMELQGVRTRGRNVLSNAAPTPPRPEAAFEKVLCHAFSCELGRAGERPSVQLPFGLPER